MTGRLPRVDQGKTAPPRAGPSPGPAATGGNDPIDRTVLAVAVAATVVAAADLLRLDLTASGSWPWPWVWAAAAAWGWWTVRRRARPAAQAQRNSGRRFPPGRAVAAAAALAAVATVAIGVTLHRADPLVGHDEAVYAGLARSWSGPLPAAGFRTYRPAGISAVGAAVLHLAGGSTDPVHQLVLLRGAAVALSLASLAALLLLGRAVTSPARAVTAVLVVLASATFQVRVAQLLDDIPAAGLLCLAALLLLRTMRTDRLGPLLGAVLAGVLAFYVRYGALAALASLVVAAVVADGPRAWWARRRQVAVAAVAGLLGLVPFAVYSVRESGTPWGVLAGAQAVADAAYPGDGLVHYVLWAPIRLLGDLGGLVLLAAMVALVLALRRPVGDDRRRWTVLLAGAGLVQVVLLGLTDHAEERFVFFPLMAAAVVGVDAVARAAGRYARPAVVLLAAFAVLQLPASVWFERHQVGGARDERIALVAAARQAGPAPCLAVGPRWGPAPDPEVGWYSGCDISTVRDARPPAVCRTGFAVLVGTGDDRDPRVERAASALLASRREACPDAPPPGPASFSGPHGRGIRLFRG